MPVSILSAAAALTALAVSLLAYRTARAAVRAHPRSESPTASVQARVLEGHARRELSDDTREYALLLSLRNEDGVPARIAHVALRVTYRTRANFVGAVDFEPQPATPDARQDRPRLEVPLQLEPGGVVSRWLLFKTANVIPRHCRVHDYSLVVMHGNGERLIVDASLASLLASDTDGQGPPTWGWD